MNCHTFAGACKNFSLGLLNGPSVYFNERGDTVRTELYRNGELIERKDFY